MTMTREQLVKRAATRGYTVHESVTDDVLGKINPNALNGSPDVITREVAKEVAFVADAATVQEWVDGRYMLASYVLGNVGDVVVLPPRTDEFLKLVTCQQLEVAAIVEGWGCDEEPGRNFEMKFTVLRQRQ